MDALIKLCLIFLLAATGCERELWQNDVPVKAMTMGSNAFAAAVWEDRVQLDIYQWRSLLPEGCPMPFHFDQDDPEARQVWLVPQSEWRKKGAIGFYHEGRNPWNSATPYSSISILALDDGSLDLYAYEPTWTVLMHELGHAMGLNHADPKYGSSVMLPAGEQVQPRDIEAAAFALGCGPPGPDPYNK
jgi:hypothetical protein